MTGELLIAFGFGWMAVAALIGLYLGAKHEGHLARLAAAAASGNLFTYHQASEVFKWRTTVHAHGMLFALSSVAVGLVLAQNDSYAATLGGKALVVALISATVIWTLAALRRIRPLMGLADLVFTGAMVATAAGLLGGHG